MLPGPSEEDTPSGSDHVLTCVDDQKLYEDETVNRMQEAMTLFESVANSRSVKSPVLHRVTPLRAAVTPD
jgi:hypothetical protein